MHRKLLYSFGISLLSFSFVAAAHADTISAGTYNVTGTTVIASGNDTTYSFTGTVTVGSNGLLTAADITLNDAALEDPVFNVVSDTGGPAGYSPVADYGTVGGSAGELYLSYLPTLNASGDIEVCILSAGDCNSYQASTLQINSASAFGYDPVNLSGGTLDAGASATVAHDEVASVAATPEPASLLLVVTGIAGLAVLGRRRLAKM